MPSGGPPAASITLGALKLAAEQGSRPQPWPSGPPAQSVLASLHTHPLHRPNCPRGK